MLLESGSSAELSQCLVIAEATPLPLGRKTHATDVRAHTIQSVRCQRYGQVEKECQRHFPFLVRKSGASLNPDSVQGGFAKMGAGHVQLLIARVLSSIIGSQGGSVDSFSQNRRGLKGGRFSASIRSNSCRTHPACPGVNGIIVTAARCQSLLAQAPLISPVVSCAPDRRRT
jgi:hypothetical protein